MTLRAIHTTDSTRFKSCRLSWDFTSPLRRNLTPIRRVPAFGFGTAWHQGLERYYEPSTPRDIEAAVLMFDKSLNDWRNSISSISVEDEQDFTEYKATGEGMLYNYAKYAEKDDPSRIKEIIWVERHYEIDIGLDDVPYSFKPDGLCIDHNGRVWIIENKSADKLPDNTEYLLMDDQCGKYIWALWEAEKIKAEGILYNIARKAYPRQMKTLKSGHLSMDKRILTTYEVALQQIAQHYGGDVPDMYSDFLARLKDEAFDRFFYRENVRRNKRELAFIKESVLAEAKEMLDPNIPIYRNPNRFNCSTCAFVGPCLTVGEGGDVEPLLEGNYETNYKEA